MEYRTPELEALDSHNVRPFSGAVSSPQQGNPDSRGDRPISVFYVIGGLSVGGTERHLSLILPELKCRGITPRVCVLDVQGPMAKPISDAGIEIDDWTRLHRRDSARRMRWLEPLVSLAQVIRLSLAMRRLKPDICHAFLPKACILAGLAARLAGHRCFVASRRSQNTYLAKHRFGGAVEKSLMRGAAAVLGNSRAVVSELSADGVPADKLGLIHNGTELRSMPQDHERTASRRIEGIAEDDLVLLTVANFLPYKGHRDLIEAIIGRCNDLPRPWRLILVGRDHGIRASLEERATEAGIADNIHFVQDRVDLDSLYRAADIAILPSHEEGFPNVVIEAMGAGLPVIATEVGGIPDAIEHGRTGLIVPPHQPVALGAAIMELARDPVRRGQFGRNGRSKFEAEFSLPLCADRYVRLYRGLAAAQPRVVSELVS